ncbi:uncharacterized protein LOC114883081 isoform X1 [Osmia bicornis bicornis]|uniref:uncharacterized protein LOC114883081 isoform X1 n=1 Tax=Osmia bicornis bicornis TaxID=1437191 RepID=UPI0010F4B1BD|nr:uncharacterized protein LOC114883081 isoform X1 [Osmia bicornis bicornis]
MKSINGVKSLFVTLMVLSVLDLILMPTTTHARPPPSLLSRQRRVSDQRLAEIETLIGLENVKGKVVTVPVAFGVVDLNKIGRRRRSATNNRLETLQRILRIVANDPELLDDEKILSLPMKMKESRHAANDEWFI